MCPIRTRASTSRSPNTAPAIWCDPYRWIPEATRLLRPGGELIFLGNSTLLMLCTPHDGSATSDTLQRDYFTMHRFEWPDEEGVEFHLPYGEWIRLFCANGLLVEDLVEIQAPEGGDPGQWDFVTEEVGSALAVRADMEGSQGRVTPRLLLASTSPQRRAILEQLGIPFDVVAPTYVEHDPSGAGAVAAVRAHAAGKARSVMDAADGRLVLGVDTTVALGRERFGKPSSEADARAMLEALAGRTHDVVSGLCLAGQDDELVEHETTKVRFRPLTATEIDGYVATGEWQSRAGGYAIQGRGAGLVEWIEGDYLNVVGLPGALLLRLLMRRT